MMLICRGQVSRRGSGSCILDFFFSEWVGRSFLGVVVCYFVVTGGFQLIEGFGRGFGYYGKYVILLRRQDFQRVLMKNIVVRDVWKERSLREVFFTLFRRRFTRVEYFFGWRALGLSGACGSLFFGFFCVIFVVVFSLLICRFWGRSQCELFRRFDILFL